MATQSQINSFISTLGALAQQVARERIAENKGFVLPSVCIAQAAIETGYGTSSLMTKANAYFGIKAGSSWNGKVYSSYTGEVYGGVNVTTYATFRAYDSLLDSVRDYFDLITESSRYSEGVSRYPDGVLTPRATIQAIWSGGYATDPQYVTKIMSIIDSRGLTSYDNMWDGSTPTFNDNEEIEIDTTTDLYKFVRLE